MPENPEPDTDPLSDILLCRLRPAPAGSHGPDPGGTALFLRSGTGGDPAFYLLYRDASSPYPVVKDLPVAIDAAAFIMGATGPGLAGIPRHRQQQIRTLFPGWFDPAGPSSPAGSHPGSGPGPQPPDAAGSGCRNSSGQSPDGAVHSARTLPPESPCPVTLWHALRHSPATGQPFPKGTDLLALEDPPGTIRFWFRHWAANGGTWTHRCEPASRTDAAAFIREQFARPGFFAGWRHRLLRHYLPEVCTKERPG